MLKSKPAAENNKRTSVSEIQIGDICLKTRRHIAVKGLAEIDVSIIKPQKVKPLSYFWPGGLQGPGTHISCPRPGFMESAQTCPPCESDNLDWCNL